MVKFRLSSLLGSNPSDSSRNGSDSTTTSTPADLKKQNRRSFSAFLDSRSASTRTKPAPGKGSKKTTTNGIAAAAPSPQPSRMAYLAEKISQETAKLDAYFKANNIPPPSFDVDADPDYQAKLPPDLRLARQEIIHATKELRDLAIGARESVRWQTWAHLDTMALQTINAFGVAKLFAPHEVVSLAELSRRAEPHLTPVNLARLVRMATTLHVFREPAPGVIAHTAASRVLAEDEDLQAWVGFNTEEVFPASANVLRALRAYPEAVHPTQTGFNFAFGTVDAAEPMFVTLGKDPARARRMGRAMASYSNGDGYEVHTLTDGYDFSEIDARGGTFVDVGGSHGFVCVHLAKQYRNMRFVVQDLPKTVESAPRPLCEDGQVCERIKLEAHDFFTEQPVKGADVYFFRWIMHNYSTPYAIKLLRNLIPALKPGARILVNDHCLTEPGTENPWDEKLMRATDLVMLALLNAQERTETEFRELFAAADEGFVFKGVIRPSRSRIAIIEAVWKPDEVKAETAEPVEDGAAEAAPADSEAARETSAKGGAVEAAPAEKVENKVAEPQVAQA